MTAADPREQRCTSVTYINERLGQQRCTARVGHDGVHHTCVHRWDLERPTPLWWQARERVRDLVSQWKVSRG